MNTRFYTNYSETKFLDKIKESLNNCTVFTFTVSFIKYAGLTLLKEDIENALRRGAIGKILTSTYQNFTDIDSLELFLKWQNQYKNFSCHLDFECFGDNGFHTKGYYFEYNDSYELLVGSSNITTFALLKNVEWDLAIYATEKNDAIEASKVDFEYLWNKTLELNDELIKLYKVRLDYAIEKWDMDYIQNYTSIKPNLMQRKALRELRRYRDMGVKKALIISATATGKTYLAAFDARNFDAKRLLFIVHRENILLEARKSFSKVFGSKYTYGVYTGNKKELSADFIFTTTSMLSQHIDMFSPTEFDYIIFDEAHHIVAPGARSIYDYFKPEFLLGLTATPERMDYKDVFELFDKNVPFELRLSEAIRNDLVTPFHYYGIRDTLINYDVKANDYELIKQISDDTHVEFIKEQIEKHKLPGKLKAVAFCKSIEHAKKLASSMQAIGYNTIALTGGNNIGERIKAFNDLQDDLNPLEIIFTVDILNEGVDIPGINMVLFLRPTESSTIFIQQLGRGLRKYENKPYLVVLDFIGNSYKRSTQIALALGSLSDGNIIEKRYLYDLLRTDYKDIKLPIQIVIDDLAKEEILKYLESTNFNTLDQLKKDYLNFKKFIGTDTYPTHMDFLTNDCAPDILRFINSKLSGTKSGSYYKFLFKIGEDGIPSFNEEEIKVIEAISSLLPLVRLDEYLILNNLIDDLNIEDLIGTNKITQDTFDNALYFLKKDKLIDEDNKLCFDINNESLLNYIKDLLAYGVERYENEFGLYEGKFKLYANYQKGQIMKVLLENSASYMQGTKYDVDTKETYIFVGLKKDKSKAELHNYKDKFLSSNKFQWESVNNTTVSNAEGQKLISTKVVHLFVRKMDEEDGIRLPFAYFGTGVFTNMRETFNGDKPTLTFDIVLNNEVPSKLKLDFNIKDNDDETL